jgi:hypothetical protein
MTQAELDRISELACARANRHLAEYEKMVETEGGTIATAVFLSAGADTVGAALATGPDLEMRKIGQLGFLLALTQATEKYHTEYATGDAIRKAMS